MKSETCEQNNDAGDFLKPLENPASRRGRPRTADWRRLEDGRYDYRPIAKSEYFRIYAMNHACVKVVCPVCNRCVNKQELSLHQKRPICQRHSSKA